MGMMPAGGMTSLTSMPFGRPMPTQVATLDPMQVGAGPLMRDETLFRDNLSARIDQAFESARMWRDQDITPRLQNCLERRQGKYDSSKLVAIRELNSVETFFNLTEAKASALEAWVNDVLADRPWDLDPSPIADLPPEVAQGIAKMVAQQLAAEADAVMQAAGALPPDQQQQVIEQLKSKTEQMAQEMAEQVKAMTQQAAKDRAEKMGNKVADQLAEGGWTDAVAETIQYLATYPYAVLKGPYLVGKRRLQWVEGGSAQVVEEPVLSWSAPNPWDVYWDPASQVVGDSYVIEISRHTPADLQIMAQAPGWLHSKLDQIVNEVIAGGRPPTQPYHDTPQRATLEFRPQTNYRPSTHMEARNFWGVVDGDDHLNWS